MKNENCFSRFSGPSRPRFQASPENGRQRPDTSSQAELTGSLASFRHIDLPKDPHPAPLSRSLGIQSLSIYNNNGTCLPDLMKKNGAGIPPAYKLLP